MASAAGVAFSAPSEDGEGTEVGLVGPRSAAATDRNAAEVGGVGLLFLQSGENGEPEARTSTTGTGSLEAFYEAFTGICITYLAAGWTEVRPLVCPPSHLLCLANRLS